MAHSSRVTFLRKGVPKQCKQCVYIYTEVQVKCIQGRNPLLTKPLPMMLCSACRRWLVPVKQHLVQGVNKLSITIRPATTESLDLR